MVSWLTFKSLIYFEFFLVCGVSWWSSFIFFFACICPVFPTPLYVLASFVKYQLTIKACIYFWALYCFIDLCVCSSASAMLFLLLWPCSVVWCQVVWYIQLRFLSQREYIYYSKHCNCHFLSVPPVLLACFIFTGEFSLIKYYDMITMCYVQYSRITVTFELLLKLSTKLRWHGYI